MNVRANKHAIRECYLSFNHIYHRLALFADDPYYVYVQQFYPRTLAEEISKRTEKGANYNYCFQVPDNTTYTASTTT